jgi:hypothetical protein
VVEGEPQEKEGSVNDETENDPGYARSGLQPDPEQEEVEEEIAAEIDGAYLVLDELEEQLAEACEEQTEWREEIDRQNLRKLLDDIDQVQRVRMLIQQIVDPTDKGR